MRVVRILAFASLLSGCAADAPRLEAVPALRTAPVTGASDLRPPLLAQLSAAAPMADPTVLDLALKARTCAIRRGVATADSRLAVIDYSRPSTEQRLWVFDMRQPRLLFDEYVAHGKGSGENFAQHFSNDDGSLQSSLGLFSTAETYEGDNGYSLRMDGLEPGVNDHARARLLVMHGAWYVDPLLALKEGRIGRSYGCPALRPQIAREVIDTLKQGQLLFAYFPDRDWLAHSRFLDCDPTPAAAEPVASFHALSN